MDRKQILTALEAIEGLHVTRYNRLSTRYALWIDVPEYQPGATQIVGELNFWRQIYTTQFPPNLASMVPDNPISRRFGQMQSQILRVLQQNGFNYKGLDERVLELQAQGVEVMGHYRDPRTVDEVARHIRDELRPPRFF